MQQILETKRLYLRTLDMIDLPDLIKLRTDIDVMRCTGGFGQEFGTGVIQDEKEIAYQLSLSDNYFNTYGLGFFGAYEKESDEFIGQAGLFHLRYNTDQSYIELAYRLHKQFWGKGYATELGQALIQWGFTKHRLTQIIAPVHPDNNRSRRVLEKCGMTCDDTINYKGFDIPCYIISNHDMKQSKI